jgi:2-isopropylmalate synthase
MITSRSKKVPHMPAPNQIVFFDTTLRDGEQSPGCTMHHAEKLRMAHQIADLGVDVLEAGFAIASDGDFNAVQAIAREVGRSANSTRIASLARCKREDIEAAARAVEPAASNRIHVFLASSDLHLEYKLRINRDQALEQTAEAVRLARTFVDDVEFSTEDGTRTDPEFLIQMITVAVQAGANTINIPDTVGYTTPAEYAAIFRMVKTRVPGIENVILSTHCHDDLGMAVANSLAGIQAGARQIECTINGIGERAGNAALEEIAAALTVRRDVYPFTSNIKMDQLYPTSQMLAEVISFGCSPNKAVVGANAFAHESGIHQHGMMANPLTYEIMTPASVGAGNTNLVLGKHSGRRALADRLEKLGHLLTREQLDEVYTRFTELADRKKSIYDQDLLSLLQPGRSTVTA